jgi:hypothetical protein
MSSVYNTVVTQDPRNSLFKKNPAKKLNCIRIVLYSSSQLYLFLQSIIGSLCFGVHYLVCLPISENFLCCISITTTELFFLNRHPLIYSILVHFSNFLFCEFKMFALLSAIVIPYTVVKRKNLKKPYSLEY